jgi:hypothetical protein
MLRLVLSAIVLVGAVAAAKPTLADPTNVTMPDREQATAAVTEQAAQPAAWPPYLDTTAQVGSGWG